MHTVIVMSEMILDKAGLVYSDVLLLKPSIVAKKLEEGGVDKKNISSTQCDLAKKALALNTLVLSTGLRGIASDVIKILITARLANYCEQKPTILRISDFSKISRNRVSPMVDFSRTLRFSQY